jgi:hypothetical protein
LLVRSRISWGCFVFAEHGECFALCHRGCAGSRFGRAKKRGVDVIADVFAGKPFDYGIDDACDQTAHSAPQRAADHPWRRTYLVTCQITINRRDDGNMLQRIDDVDDIAEAEIFEWRWSLSRA